METKKLLYLGNKLGSKGYTPTAIDVLAPRLEAEGVQVISVSSKKNKILRLIHMLWSVLRFSSNNSIVFIDTYSTLNFWYARLTASLCRLKKMPYVSILHGGNLPNRLKKNKKIVDRLFKNASVNVAPSHYLLKAFTDHGYTNVIYIPNTISIEDYSFQERLSVDLKLLWVRSFAKIYNPLLAIKVLRELKQKGYNATLTMVGPVADESFDECRDLASTHNLNVNFTGKLERSEWIELAADHDIFINTTNFDNTPVSVIEAMALGLVVVSTNVGGIPYLLAHDEDALLVVPNDVETFVAAIERLKKNPDLAQKLTQNARNKVEQFNWDVVKHQWLSLLHN